MQQLVDGPSTESARALDRTTTDGNGFVPEEAAKRNGQDDPGSVEDTGATFTYSVSNLFPGDAGTLIVEMSLTDGTADAVARFAFDLIETAENS